MVQGSMKIAIPGRSPSPQKGRGRSKSPAEDGKKAFPTTPRSIEK